MATPALRSLRAHFPAARITGVMRPVIADLLAGTPWLDATVFYDRHRAAADTSFAAAARSLRAIRPDLVVIFPNSLSAAVLAWRGGARRRVGAAGHWRRWLLTDLAAQHRDERGRPTIVPPPEAFMDVVGAAGVPQGGLDVELAVTSADRAAGDALLGRLFPGRSGPLVILNDNSSNGPARAWGADKHARLATWLLDRLPTARVLVHCGPGDREQARDVVEQAGHPGVRGMHDEPDLPIGLSKAVFADAALAVSSDSGPRHIAAAFGVPTVALVGPVDPRLGRSDPAGCVEIRLDLACSPCGRKECPLVHHDCMRLIGVEQVGRTALELLARHDQASRAG
ncbi:MAG: ADP-heptose--LPS heptosyltransferase 2, partial [Planctomycetota bacterium]